MGHKSICLDCRRTLNRGYENGVVREHKCPECGKQMILLPHRFRPPKKDDEKKWETVKFLLEHGFYYQHIYKRIDTNKNGVTSYNEYAEYPENMIDAKEFVEAYKQQAKRDK